MFEFLCALPLAASLFTACEPPLSVVGYMEGEYVLIAPIENARVLAVNVRRGDRIEAGQPLVALERRDADIAVAQSRAALAQAISQLANLRLGKRAEEIAMVGAGLASAEAQAAEDRRTLSRKTDLLARKAISQANFDTASTSLVRAEAKVKELQANLAVAKLPARPDEIKAAEAAVEQARAVLENAQWRLDNRTLVSPDPGKVFDIIRNPGEVAGPQAPVLSVLPDGAVKLRVYVGEPALSQVGPGTRLDVRCDGCGDGMTATVTYVASDPVFTPPVIYSLKNRQKLVYLVEAKPDAAASALKPGQIVDVVLNGTGR
ncbi:MAG: HlyD family secretion protein [Alphaproteobacteria bacterium]